MGVFSVIFRFPFFVFRFPPLFGQKTGFSVTILTENVVFRFPFFVLRFPFTVFRFPFSVSRPPFSAVFRRYVLLQNLHSFLRSLLRCL